MVEPEQYNFELAVSNTKVNGMNQIEGVNAGLWYKSEMLSINNSFRDQKNHSFSVNESQSDSQLQGFQITELIRNRVGTA